METLNDILTVMKGIALAVESISSTIALVSSILGFSVIIVLLIIFAVSSGLASIGVAKGKTNFFVSLFITDVFWFLWGKGYYQGDYMFVLPMLKTNLIILSPFITIYLLKRYLPDIYFYLLNIIFKAKKISVIKGKSISEKIILESALLQSSLQKDIFNSNDSKVLRLSSETLLKINSMKNLLDDIYKLDKK